MATFKPLSKVESVNTRTQFRETLENMGGVCTFDQAEKMAFIIDGKRLPYNKYHPHYYFKDYLSCHAMTADYNRKLICSKPMKDIPFSYQMLLGISLILDCCEDMHDIMSAKYYSNPFPAFSFLCEGAEYMLFFATSDNTKYIANAIISNEKSLERYGVGNVEMNRPHYMILVTDTDEGLKSLALERIGELNIQYPHTVVTYENTKTEVFHPIEGDYTPEEKEKLYQEMTFSGSRRSFTYYNSVSEDDD